MHGVTVCLFNIVSLSASSLTHSLRSGVRLRRAGLNTIPVFS